MPEASAQTSHGGSQGFKSPHLHPTTALVTGLAGRLRRAQRITGGLVIHWQRSLPSQFLPDVSHQASP